MKVHAFLAANMAAMCMRFFTLCDPVHFLAGMHILLRSATLNDIILYQPTFLVDGQM